MAALVLAGVLAAVVYRTRAPNWNELARDQFEEDATRLRRQELLADEFDAKAHAAQVEIDIKTVRASRLKQQASVRRREAVTSREQLTAFTEDTHKPTGAG
ncbi:MAG TPA: hypothetical protein VL634_04805 [Mycobacterium sp.]|nr:hypothetical protein [Mycobacterium sp.]